MHNHWDVEVMFLALEDMDLMQEAYAQVGTVDFADIVREHSEWLEDDDEVEIHQLTGPTGLLGMLEEMMLSAESREALLEMEAGEVFGPVVLHDWDQMTGNVSPFEIMIYIVSRDDEIVLSEVETDLRERMINARRADVFNDLVIEDWVEEANFRINQRGYDTV